MADPLLRQQVLRESARNFLSIFAAIVLLTGCASIGRPELDQISVKLDPAAIDFRELSFYGERALLSYSSGEKIKRRFPRTVRVASPAGTDVQYFLELDHQSKAQYVSVRGSVDSRNFSEDLDVRLSDDSHIKVPVHAGFDSVASALYSDIKPHLVPGYKTHLTGHSLGAAVAAIVMIYMVNDRVQVVRMVGFGQPKFTTVNGAAALKSLPMIRVVEANDVVPMLPPSTMLDPIHGPYEHVGPELILLDGPRYVYLNAHDASRISVGEFWRSASFARLADHSMKRYLKRLQEKHRGAVAVTYGDREAYVTSGSTLR
jgi:hypothetical protein